jgi:VanZ family protein
MNRLYPGGVSSSPQALHFLAEKGVHFTLYFVFGLLLWKTLTLPRRARFVTILAVGLVMGCSSEFLQRFFPGRDPSVRDVLINFTSAALGASVGLVLKK